MLPFSIFDINKEENTLFFKKTDKMITDLNTLEKIEAYVNGFMVSPELELFEIEILLSSELQDEVNFQKMIQQILISNKIKEKEYKVPQNSFFLIWTKILFPIHYN